MTWECQSTLIIMLTTIVERGRIKCHKYWPDVGDTIDYGLLAVTCITEDKRENFVFREFSIQHKENQEVRQVTQVSKLVSNRYIYRLLIFNLRKCFITTVALDINKLRQEQMT